MDIVEELEVSAGVRVPPAEVFEVLVDFPGYVEYSEYLESVDTRGDGGFGTEYLLHFAWWRVEYTVRSRVTDIHQPSRISFEIVDGIEASGEWQIEATEENGAESVVRLVVRYDADTIGGDAVSLPALLPLGAVIERAEPYLHAEAEQVVERVVADLEGEPRAVDVTVRMESVESG